MSQEFITATSRDTVLLHISDIASVHVSSLAKKKAYEWVKNKAWDMDIAEWADEGNSYKDIAKTIAEIVQRGIVDGIYTAEQLA